jgi:hypothetical protein
MKELRKEKHKNERNLQGTCTILFAMMSYYVRGTPSKVRISTWCKLL